jgi:hypothetical protein
MDQTQFNELHRSCAIAFQGYATSAELTAGMPAKCAPEPIPGSERLSLLAQEANEIRAHCMYLDCKHVLHDAARLAGSIILIEDWPTTMRLLGDGRIHIDPSLVSAVLHD